MSSSGIGQFIPLILIFIIFYFFFNQTTTKKSQRTQNHGSKLKKR